MKPLASIFMPTFNRLKYIGESIDSAVGQSIGEWELLIIDDGPTDITDSLGLHFQIYEIGYELILKHPAEIV